MLLVIGGHASGKSAYAASLGYDLASPEVLDDFEELVGQRADEALAKNDGAGINDVRNRVVKELLQLASQKEIVICDEVGSGIIPATLSSRLAREATGQLCTQLAKRRDCKVVRLVCGVPEVVKDPDRMMTVTLLRHAKTTANFNHFYSGHMDVPLCEEGEEYAQEVGGDASVARVYVTPLSRTQHTAKLLFPAATQVVVDGLMEMNFGDFEGRTAAEMKDDPAYEAWIDSNTTGVCPNGESRGQFAERTCIAFSQLLGEAHARGERDLVIVAHGGTQMSLLGAFASPRRPYWEWVTDNCCGYRFEVDPVAWRANPVITDPLQMAGARPSTHEIRPYVRGQATITRK